jgi:4-aminobutyrate aminotransferase-like enzyme
MKFFRSGVTGTEKQARAWAFRLKDAGRMVYKKAFSKGLAWIPAENVLRLAPPLIMTEELAGKALEIIDESIWETEKHFS